MARAGHEQRYIYDPVGNRLSLIDTTTSDTDLDGVFSEADLTLTTAQQPQIWQHDDSESAGRIALG